MNESIQNQWSEVKKIKFHHKVKRFYYKNLFRKIYIVAIVGLIATNVFSLFKYQTSADYVLSNGVTVIPHPENVIFYTLNGNENFTAGTITISDGATTITILDRNLGATVTGTGCTEGACYEGDPTYGCNFQRGNNYGFTGGGELPTGQLDWEQVDASDVGANYSSGVFHTASNWINDNSKVDMRGGNETDNIYSINDTTRQVNNPTERKGPCPENFHVPSKGELDKLKNMMGDNQSLFHNILKIPFAGSRDRYDGHLYEAGGFGYLWSSSPYSISDEYSRHFLINYYSEVDLHETDRGNSMPIRCFYDEYDEYVAQTPSIFTLTFVDKDDNTQTIKTITNIESGTVITGGMLPEPPAGYEYLYYDSGANLISNILSVVVDADMTILVSVDTRNTATLTEVSYGYILTYDGKSYIIASDDLSGSYYWGHNYPTTDTEHGGNNATSTVGKKNNGVWGGGNDTEREHFSPTPTNYRDRQGPCSKGYYIPSRGEWQEIVTARCHLSGNDCTQSDLSINSYGNLNYISKEQLPEKFKQNFNMLENNYWSSSPARGSEEYAWQLLFGSNKISLGDKKLRSEGGYIRCIVNPNSIFILTFRDKNNNSELKNFDSVKFGQVITGGMLPDVVDYYTTVYYDGDDVIDDISSVIITADTTILVDRVPNKITVTYHPNGGTEATSLTGIVLADNDSWIAKTAGTEYDVSKTGYHSVGKYLIGNASSVELTGSLSAIELAQLADKTENYKTGDISVDLYVVWAPNRDTPYQVEYYQENVEGGYTLVDTDNQTGTTGEPAEIHAKNYEGFTVVLPEEENIAADGLLVVRVEYTRNSYDLTIINDEDSQIKAKKFGEIVVVNPLEKQGYTFKGWEGIDNLVKNGGEYTMPASNVILTAKWEKISESSSHSSSRRKHSENKDDTKQTHESAETIPTDIDDATQHSQTGDTSTTYENNNLDTEGYDSRYTPEQHSAYQFAKDNGITTTSTIREARMNTPLTRIEMAKMLSYYAINVLHQTPDASRGVVKFRDVSDKLNVQYDDAVTLAYQLGIMGINMPNNRFRPKSYVTRGEFATALSRMIYGMEDGEGNLKYYEPHIARLYNEGIINNTNPTTKELRGYVMIMLMRTSK